MLALMLQARYEDGSPISDGHVADELLTLLAAGHETTATTLAWTIERLRRHPQLLSRLTAEVDAGGSELRQATIWEVQRTRPVVEATARVARERMRLGEWVIPKNHAVIASITLAHQSEQNFADAKTFNPDRFLGSNPDTHTWIPFGGGIRRCIGAAFANMEMNVTLRTLLREFEFGTTHSAGERIHSRGVATAPGRGGRAVVYRRRVRPQPAPSRATRKRCRREMNPVEFPRWYARWNRFATNKACPAVGGLGSRDGPAASRRAKLRHPVPDTAQRVPHRRRTGRAAFLRCFEDRVAQESRRVR